MRYRLLVIVGFVAMGWFTVAHAGDDLKLGTSGAQELRIPVGSRGTALGGSAVALNCPVEKEG